MKSAAVTLLLLALAASHAARGAESEPKTAADLYQPKKIWTVQLTISPEQFKIMQPRVDPIDPNEPPRPNGYAARQGWVFDPAHADFEFNGQKYKDVSVRYKGNGSFVASRFSLKISFKVDLNKYVKTQKLAGVTEVEFHSDVRDVSFMNELLAYRLYRAEGVPAPRVGYARVFLTVPGKYDHRYVGLYSMVEPVDDDFAADVFHEAGGGFFKPVSPDPVGYRGEDWASYDQEWDPKAGVTDAQKRRVIDFASFLTSATEADFANRIGDFLEVDKFARMLATTVYVGSLDGFLATGQNIYAYLSPKTNRFTIIPWDHDEAWGSVVQTQDIRNTLNIFNPMISQKWLGVRLFRLDAFRKPYFETLADLALNAGTPEKLAAQQDEMIPILRPALAEQKDEAVELFDLATHEGVVPRLVGVGFIPYLSVKSFSKARQKAVLEQLATN